MSTIDLHMHSIISLDGEYTPAELAHLCFDNGLKTVALTDHNSVRGVSEMIRETKKLGINAITGIELDCTCEDLDLHILGYGIDINDKRFEEIENDVLAQKQKTCRQTLNILSQAGIHFDMDKVMSLARDGVVVGEMIAEAALQDDRNLDNPLMKPYYPGQSRSDNPYVNFFWDFCSQGKIAFLPVHYISADEAISLIRDTGGAAVIAHPGATVKRREDLISRMVSSGVTGLEVYSSYHDEEQIAYYEQLAEKFHLVKTMGSDFHGKTKPAVKLGGIRPGNESFTIKSLLP